MRKFYSEAAYILGISALALGTALTEAADLGMSMVVAPAYLIYLKLSQTFGFFTFGMAEYLFQALLLAVMILAIRKFEIRYLFAFATAVFYGLLLDLCMLGVGLIPTISTAVRVIFFVSGFLSCAFGVSLLFQTYISPEVYELFVKEISKKYGFPIHKCKMVYDCISCAVAILMSFLLFGFGKFEGIKLGTVISALLNGITIGAFSRFLEKHFVFTDLLRGKKALDKQE